MKRSSMNVMMRLLELVKPLTGTMILAVTMGVAGHLCAIGIPCIGSYGLNRYFLEDCCICAACYCHSQRRVSSSGTES